MKPSRLWLLAPWLLFALIALGWVGYWNIVAGEAESRIAQWAEHERNTGAQVSYARPVRHGFPVLLRLELHDIAYAPARGGWSVATPRADLNVEMLNPEHIILKSLAPISVTRSDHAVTNISADALIASLRTSGGSLAVAGIEADNLRLDDPAQPGILQARKVVANVRPDPRAPGEYQLAFEATMLTLPRPVRSFESFGLDIPTLRAAIVVQRGAELLHAAPGDPLGPWREAGGKLRFEALALTWGPLQATGTGEGTLDAQRRLQGRLVVPIERPAPVLTAISNGPNIDNDARHALGLLAATYVVNGDQLTLDVNAANGVLTLEGLPLRTLPPVY